MFYKYKKSKLAVITCQQGFTLIELMIAVGIIGILSMVALPSYITYVQDGRRVDVQHYTLQQIAILERQYTREGEYRNAGTDTTEFSIAATDFYSFTYTPAATGTLKDKFTITISPKSGSAQAGDKCGVMTINHLGKQTATPSSLSNECWGH